MNAPRGHDRARVPAYRDAFRHHVHAVLAGRRTRPRRYKPSGRSRHPTPGTARRSAQYAGRTPAGADRRCQDRRCGSSPRLRRSGGRPMDRCRAGVADEAGGFRTPLPTLIAISTGSPPSLRMPCGWLTLFSTVSLGPNRASITSSPQAQATRPATPGSVRPPRGK